ncbi:MAG: NAD-dependent succinate-semialdehyde dehydrogenase [FCB group bacterium]|nr:NAD-dependent succinate-semialdehyde dehydrogenase [FCB group bacterium]
MDVINPTTGALEKSYTEHSPQDVTQIIETVHTTYQDWKRTSFAHRSRLMKNAARVLREKAQDYAELMAVEMGKPVKEGRAEVEKCAWVCDYYADNAEGFLSHDIILTEARKSFIAYRPIGIVLAVMPWNFPFWQVLRFAAPALMAGNGGVLKHASNVPGSALAIEDVFRQAGFPDHIFRTLLIGSRQVASVIENPLVKAVTLTGSTPAGKAVASKAGEMLKKTVLELGGSDPYVVLEDADVALAATTCSISRMINGGQSCIAAKRFVVVESVRAEFERLLLERMQTVVMGDPLKEETTLGPQAREDLRDELHAQVEKSIEKGAKVLIGGEIPEGPGAFYPATVLTDVSKGMPAYDEELFGPVAAIIPVKDEAEAIKVANDTIFGLGSAVFTRDVEKGERIATEELEAGAAFVNAYVKSDPRLPFGGIKESGYGRELAANGIREFVNIKTVYIK